MEVCYLTQWFTAIIVEELEAALLMTVKRSKKK